MSEKATNRAHKDVSEVDIIKALKTWQCNREQWGPTEASRKLGYPKGTLIGWRDQYSDRTLSKDPAPLRPANRLRAPGGGRKRKALDCEGSVREYYAKSLRQDGRVRNADILAYCRTKKEFTGKVKSNGAQAVWMLTLSLLLQPLSLPTKPPTIPPPPQSSTTAAIASDANALDYSLDDAPDDGPDDARDDARDDGPDNGPDDPGEAPIDTPQSPAAAAIASNVAPDDDAHDGILNDTPHDGRRRSSSAPDHDAPMATTPKSGNLALQPRKRYTLRDRGTSAKFLFRYPNEERSSFPSRITVGVYPADLFSVEPCQPLTASVVDFVICKRIARGKGFVYPFGSLLFVQIEHVDQSTKSFSAVKELVDKVEWDCYPVVLIPVAAVEHWSLLIVEHPLSDRVQCYHVDSVAAKHQSEYVFDVAKLFLEEISGHSAVMEGLALTMQSEQRNYCSCGVYMLYCINKIAQHIVQNSPKTLMNDIRKLTSKCTASKADKFRASMRGEFQKRLQCA
ncbi:hypothetical protein F442_13685 [Phytophthora nicotianae P10297]|uniref:Ubiquitin-like protease family profile domain-containing protein n=1 Tax=Phytophthora nicotianae P10297 TaxID=1317064 RepID=W2YUJ2_PHYNI|nr:hypothetical protein F442_13685 [Phytophthora nicotianae P10297]